MHTTLGRLLQPQMHGTAPAGNSWRPVDAVNAASLATLRSKGSHTDNSVPFNVVSDAVLSAADAAAAKRPEGQQADMVDSSGTNTCSQRRL